MRDYYFWYVKGTSRPEGHISAETHGEFYAKLGPWLKEHGGVIDAGTQVYWQKSGLIPPVPPASLPPIWSVCETEDGGQMMVRDPSDIRERFFARKAELPELVCHA